MKHLLANQIRIFITVVEAGSITGAANRLGMGKSGVSDALKQLEQSLGIQLIIRTTRRQKLTPIGEKFLHRCKALHDLSTIALEEVNEHLAEPRGPLRITAPHALVRFSVAPAIASLTQRYPQVEPELIVDDKRLDLVEHRIDLALTVGELPVNEFKARRVGILRDILCTSPMLCHKLGLDSWQQVTRELIADLPYVAHQWEKADPVYALKAKDTANTETFHFRRVATAHSVHADHALILQGLGMGLLPHFFLRENLERGELIDVLPGYEPRSQFIYAVHPYGSFPPLGVRVMIDALIHTLDKHN